MPKLDSRLRREVQEYLKETGATKEERATVWQMVHEGYDYLSSHLCEYGHGVRHSDYRMSVKMPLEKALQKTDMDTCSSLSRTTR